MGFHIKDLVGQRDAVVEDRKVDLETDIRTHLPDKMVLSVGITMFLCAPVYMLMVSRIGKRL